MSEAKAPLAIGEVRSAAQVLNDDVMCQSFIQGSSTLAYACLLIRRSQYEMAGHVLRHLEGRKSGRYRDIVFYIQAQIEIELGLYSEIKTRLVQRLREHPSDAVGLSLLQACIQAELLEAKHAVQGPAESTPESLAFEPMISGNEPPPALPLGREEFPLISSAADIVASDPAPEWPAMQDLLAPVMPGPSESMGYGDAEEANIAAVVAFSQAISGEPRPIKPQQQASASAEVDLMPFQAVIQDAGTLAFIVWESRRNHRRMEVKDSSLETLVNKLPSFFPGEIARPVRGLDAGKTTKTCFAFGKLTVTSLHQGSFHCGLITGPLNQSLIAMVRTETLFAKRASQLLQAGEIDAQA